MSAARVTMIRERLERAFAPASLDIRDDSALHAGHAGARDGAGHFAVRIRASAFRAAGRIARHRMVYEALADMMPKEIHALSIDAAAPDERD